MSWLVRRFSLRAALRFGRALGWLWFHILPVRRRVALANLARAFPEKTPAERVRIARQSFAHWAQSAIELLRLRGPQAHELMEGIERKGGEHLDAALAAGRGVLAVTAHFGNFDLLACAEAWHGLPLHVVTRRQHQAGVDRFWMETRQAAGVHFLADRETALAIRRVLKRNEVMALLIDQHTPGRRGIRVPFFGEPAATTPAPALFSLTSGAPILPTTIERLPGGEHRLTFEAPWFPPEGGVGSGLERERAVAELTLRLNQWLEGRIRECPEQWLWIHRRWKPLIPTSQKA